MGDDDVGQAVVSLQPLHQVEHLRPDRHVKRADRLVRDDDLRVQGEGPGQPDPLPLPAGELVRIALDRAARQADLVEQFVDALITADRPLALQPWPIQLEVYLVRSVSLPDGTWVASWPCQKGELALNAISGASHG